MATRCLAENLGLCLFAEYLRAAVSNDDDQPHDRAVRQFTGYVQNHLDEETCLTNGCIEAGISRNALIYKLRAAMRITPARYVWRARTERGVAMLRETGLTVSEISYKCGFKSPFHFSRLVKKQLGRSPREIRAWSQTLSPFKVQH
jgi:AraC-like DNA-binding protein